MSRFVLTAQLQLQAPTNTAQVVRQIQSQLNNVQVNVQVQGTAQATRQVQQVAQSLNAANSAASNLGRTFAISVKRFTALAVATRAVSLFTNTLANAVNEAIDFERQLIKVAQVTGQTIGELRFLTKSITDLSTGLGVSSKDLLNTSQLLLQAGVSARDTEVALKTLAKAALAPNFDSLSETTEGAIAILAQFQEGVGSLEGQLSSINAVAGAFAVEAGDLIDVIRRTGGVFKSSGGSLNELIALFTSVRATTRESAESIGTGLRTIFTRIQRPKTIEFLKQFGVELVDLEGKFVGPFEAVRRLSEALTGLGERDITFIRIAEELGGFRQIGKVLPLLQQFKTSQEALNVAQKAGTGLTKDAETAQQALAIRITKVQEEFLALVRAITETSSFQFFANTTLNLASALIKLADALKPIIPLLTAVATIKLARGLSSFVGGFGRGIGSGRTFNKGGKVLGFARGGMVPGTGNRDTVPAMLQPGEFVIRKSSVNKLGAGNLAAMNSNKYAAGGVVTNNRNMYGDYGPNGSRINPAMRKVSQNPEDRRLGGKGRNIQDISIKKPPFASKQTVGIATTSVLDAVPGNVAFSRDEMLNQVIGGKGISLAGKYGSNAVTYFNQIFKSGKSKGFAYNTIVEGIGKDEETQFKNIIDQGITSAITGASQKFASEVIGAPLSKPIKILPSYYETIDGGFRGQFFENIITALNGAPLRSVDSQRPFDFTRGIGKFKKIYSNLGSLNYIDSRISAASAGVSAGSETIASKEIFKRKSQAQLALELLPTMALLEKQSKLANRPIKGQEGVARVSREIQTRKAPALIDPVRFSNFTSGQDYRFEDIISTTGINPNQLSQGFEKIGGGMWRKKFFGGLIQKFAAGGRAKGILPRPSAINDLIKSGGGYVDIDRTLLRTVGDIAYGKARTEQEKQAVLQKYFLDPVARLKDIKSVGLTQFGKQLQASIKSGQIQGSRLRVLSKSTEVPGVRSYLSGLFGIPPGNMRFTAGGSKVPFMRNRGPLVDDIPSNARFASGGSVGTDTVPALLTPGEFVVNKKSAQSIGYGALGRMNKVGKYAKGGVVQKFATGGQAQGNSGSFFGGFGAQLALATASLQALIPPVNENSSAISKVTNNLLSFGTTIGASISALEAIGIKLEGSDIVNFYSGKGLPVKKISDAFNNITGGMGDFGRVLRASTQATARGGIAAGKAATATATTRLGGSTIGTKIAGKAGLALGKIAPVIQGVSKLAGGPIGIATQAIALINDVVGSFRNLDGQLKKSIEAGDSIKAASLAAKNAAASFPLVGNLIGGFSDTLDSGLIRVQQAFGGPSLDSIKALASVQAGAVKTQKQLEQAQKSATNAMEDFQNGSISASEALARIRASSSEVQAQEKRASDFATKNLQNRSEYGSGAIARNIFSLGGLNPFMENAAARNERLGKESAGQIEQASKFEAQRFQMETEGRKATIRSGFARGANPNDIRREAVGDLQTRLNQQTELVSTLQAAGDTEGAKAAMDSVNQLSEQINQVNRELVNLEKEVARAKAAFDAMNLDLRGPTATANAMSASMNKFAASLEVGGNTFVSNTEFLSQAVTSAAQAMDRADIKAAIDDVASNLQNMGIDPTKFRTNTEAFVKAQRNYNAAFEKVRNDLRGRLARGQTGGNAADDLKDAFAKELTVGLGDEAKKNLEAIINNIELSPAEVDKILSGDVSVFGDKLSEAGQKQVEEILKIAQERQKAEQVVINFIKQRAESERNLAQAQKEAIDLYMEGRDIQAKYGGTAVSNEEKRAAVLGRANAGAKYAGLSNLRTGSIAELRQRNTQISAGFSNIENQRQLAGGMQGAAGVQSDEMQKNIQQAQKDQIQTIRDLIKLEEENLKLIGEKNKLEKDSIDALVSGDIDKFFEQQAAAGAQAAIALGSERLQGAFGANALGAAAQDIKRQQEAGQQTLFGQQLAGAGGLTERAFGAAIGARGITDPRLAQVAAGTTAEENAAQSRLRDLGGVLGETGQLGIQMAEMQLETANINVNNATAIFSKIEEEGKKVTEGEPVPALNKGGLIYANRGIFVPRGTDTVPAMLTPGEFVVRREAVQRGNNLQMLQAMNRGSSTGQSSIGGAVGMANGGMVRYRADGSTGPESGGMGLNTEVITRLAQSLDKFNTDLSSNIDKLNSSNFNIKLDTTNVNVNLTGSSFLSKMKDELRDELMGEIGNKITNYKSGEGGSLRENRSVLG
jgi:TP901 family phage tail tape measure protein